jgi:hypothetical protein
MPTDVDPPLELVPGYPRLTITPHFTRIGVPAADEHSRTVSATAALIIRADLEEREGTINRRWTGRPRVTADGTMSVVMANRSFRRRHRIIVTPADIAARLHDWATA